MNKSTLNKLSCLLLIIPLLGGTSGCRRHDDSRNEKKIAQTRSGNEQEAKRPLGQQRMQGKARRAVGQGQERRGYGRGVGRSWDISDIIELTDEEKSVIGIETIKAKYLPLKSRLSAMGKVLEHPYRKAIVSYAFPARIAEIHARIGDWVKKGQPVVTLQSEEVGSAKSEFYKAQADYELAKVNYERQKRLFDRGVGSQKDFLSTESEYKVAEATVNAAEKKLHVLGFNEEQVKSISETHQINPIITLYAPLSGKITINNAVLGAMIDQGTEILTIMDPTILCIDAQIYEKDISKIHDGQGVEVTVPAFPGEKFNAEISFISDVLNEETRTITVRSEAINDKFKLKPGMFADIQILLNHQSNALVLPKEAILDEGGDTIVFLKKADAFYPQLVELGAREDSLVEILRGIVEGDEVVTKGNFQLKSKLYDEILKKGHVH
ncbi:MAG: efflux RND transporter periplasmic adaptor subunit [Candidatus Aminicenantes bacterium]|nr:efflux RND transporter periplasmic adaptor subunit [Candidatus Aminicenantes bacterium]